MKEPEYCRESLYIPVKNIFVFKHGCKNFDASFESYVKVT